ncbi:MAG TPA: DUF6067 family protein [bacterium]|nr:DUF6067 family protein [bacterium]
MGRKEILKILLSILPFSLYLNCSEIKLPPEMPVDNLIFYVRYDDQTVQAYVAGGKRDSLNFTRTLQYEQVPGVIGSGFRTFPNETCLYDMKGNFHPEQGTLSLWIRPDNWKIREAASVFFSAEIPGIYKMLLYTSLEKPYLNLDVSLPDKNVNRRITGKVNMDTARWTRVDIIWDRSRIKMYIDGLLAGEDVLPEGTILPEATDNGKISINPNGYFGKDGHYTKLTTVDEVMIYNVVLPEQVFQKSYSAIMEMRAEKYRNPIVTIPKTRISPVVDGILEPEEWKDASVVQARHMGGRARFSEKEARIYLKYDDKNFYLGFYAPDDLQPKASIKGRDGNVWEDGAFEFICQPPSADKKIIFQFVINSINTVFDMLNGDRTWDGVRNTAAKSGLPGGGWSAEVSLPFSAIGVPVPNPGDMWQGNFMYDWDQIKGGYATWSVFIPEGGEGYFANRRTFGTFVFGDDTAGVHLDRIGNLVSGAVDISVSPATSGVKKKVEIKITSDITEPLSVSLDSEVAHPAVYTKQIPAGASGILSITVKNGQDNTEFLYDQHFKVQPSLSMNYSIFPSKRRIDIKVDMTNAPDDIKGQINKGNYSGVVSLEREGDKAVIFEQWILKSEEDKKSICWEGRLEEGNYILKVSFPGQAGTKYEQERKFTVPSYEPFEAAAGSGHIVPDPWTPVKVKGNTVYVIGREYILNESPFPEQFISLGEKILTSPVNLNITTDKGKETIKWGKRRIVESFDDRVTFAGEGKTDKSGLSIGWSADVEFDGQWLVHLKLEPGDNRSVAIERMEIEYSVKRDSGEYVKALLLKRWQDNTVDLDLFDKIDSVVGAQSPRGTFWLTGVKTGLHFFTTTNANWIVPDKKNNVHIEKGEKEVTARITIIGKQVILKMPADYIFAFTATPAKPRPVKNWAAGDHEYIFQVGPWQNWTSLVHLAPDKLKKSIEEKRRRSPDEDLGSRGTKYFYQYSFPGIIEEDPYYAFWGQEWSGNKVTPGSGCPNSKLKELITYRVENLARDSGIGPYFDMCSISWCNNDEHGCGFTDSFRQDAKTIPILGFRELMKRVYIITHRYGCRVWNHDHSQFLLPVHIFSDIWFPGEQYTHRLVGDNHFYSQGVSREEYLIEMNPYIHGVNIIFLPELARAYDMAGYSDFEKYQKGGYEWYTEQLLAMLLPHDIDCLTAYIPPGPIQKVYKIYKKHNVVVSDAIPEKGGIFTGYWENPAIKVDDASVMLSYYRIPGEKKIIAVAGNPTLKEKTVHLFIDCKKLGLPEMLSIRDEYRDADLSDWKDKGIKIPAENFVILLITPEK